MKITLARKMAAIAASLFLTLPVHSAQMASQNWVEMKIEQAMTNILNRMDGLSPSDDSHSYDYKVEASVNATNQTFSFVKRDGETVVIPFEVATEPYDRQALMVYDSEKSNVTFGTIFAYDEATASFRNSSVSIPEALYLSATGDGKERLSWTNATEDIVAFSQKSGVGEPFVVFVYMKRAGGYVDYDTLFLGRITVQEGTARLAGVTNATARTFLRSSPRPGVLSARGDSACPPTGVVTFTLNLEAYGFQNKTETRVISYHGGYSRILVDPPGRVYLRHDWPTEDEWGNKFNWLEDHYSFEVPVVDKIYDEEGNVSEETNTVYFSFGKRNMANLPVSIPPYSLPPTRERTSDDCKDGDHKWQKCVCSLCGEKRAHNYQKPESGEGCFVCANKNGHKGWNGSICGEQATADNESWHVGWHHEGAPGASVYCVCSCRVCRFEHRFKNDNDDEFEIGAMDEYGKIIAGTESMQHSCRKECSREGCEGYSIANDNHAWEEDDSACWPWKGFNPDNDYELIFCAADDPEANKATHVNTKKECKVCSYVGYTYESHEHKPGKCKCTKCGVISHKAAVTCGNVTYCPKCGCDPETNVEVLKASEMSDHDLSLIGQYGIGHDDVAHWCLCGKKRAPHDFDRADINGKKTCTVCGYQTGGEEEEDSSTEEDTGEGGGTGGGDFTCDEDRNIHIKKEHGCGCRCGLYPEEIVGGEGMHVWQSGKCYCECGGMHRFVSGNPCPQICNVCKSQVAKGVVDKHSYERLGQEIGSSYESQYHKPCTEADQHCGCKCGRYDVRNDSSVATKFHVQMPETCKCYGTGSGGDYHYPQSGNECPAICKLCREENGGLGYLYTKDSPTKGKTAAKESDHVAADGKCGCKCGGVKETTTLEDFHLFGTKEPKCVCVCERYHWSNTREEECPDICAECSEYKMGANWGYLYTPSFTRRIVANVAAKVSNHNPVEESSDHCGCKCGVISVENGNVKSSSVGDEFHVRAVKDSVGKVLVDDSRTTCLERCACQKPQKGKEKFTVHYRSSKKCVCYCGNSGIHCPVPTAGCPDVCAGGCEGLCADKTPGASKGKVTGYDHTPKKDGCGCACGAYGAEAYEMKSLAERGALYHNGENKGLSCRCECGKYHPMLNITPCPGCPSACIVCDYNADLSQSGAGVHTMSSCRCVCGKYTGPAILLLSFHPIESKSCSCECGSRTVHSQNPDACGCWCGKSTKSESDHRYADDACTCYCGAKHRNNFRRTDCTQICAKCGGRADSNTPKMVASATNHTPKSNGCGCACGKYGASSYADKLDFHSGANKEYSCWCECGRFHIAFTSSGCPNVCSTCGRTPSGDNAVASDHKWASDSCKCYCGRATQHKQGLGNTCYCYCGGKVMEHRYSGKSCKCYCGSATSHYQDPSTCYCYCGSEVMMHKYDDDKCVCKCEKEERDHDLVYVGKHETNSYVCASCKQNITEYEAVYECRRCGKSMSGLYESGHLEDCGYDKTVVPKLCYCKCSDMCDVCRKKKKSEGDVCIGCTRSCYEPPNSGGSDEKDDEGDDGGKESGGDGSDDELQKI